MANIKWIFINIVCVALFGQQRSIYVNNYLIKYVRTGLVLTRCLFNKRVMNVPNSLHSFGCKCVVLHVIFEPLVKAYKLNSHMKTKCITSKTKTASMMTSWNGNIFSRYWPFVRGIHRSPVNSRHKGQWRGALVFSLISTRINGWVNNEGVGDLRRYGTHYDVTVMSTTVSSLWPTWHHMATQTWVNTGSGNRLLPPGTKPLPEPT